MLRGPSNELVIDPNGDPIRLSKTRTLHGGRVLTGYGAEFNESLSFAADVEYIQAITNSKLLRVNASTTMAAKVKGKWSIAAAFTLGYENQPLPNKDPLDTTTTLNVVYTVL